jgi:hypothetical protein
MSSQDRIYQSFTTFIRLCIYFSSLFIENIMSCYKCGKFASKLCDGKINDKTCEREARHQGGREMCALCANLKLSGIACRRGKGLKSHVFTIDYCDECNLANRDK